MNLELTEEAKEIAKRLGLTDDEIDSFWFRMGYAMSKKNLADRRRKGGG